MLSLFRSALCLTFVLILAGCGYRFDGVAQQSKYVSRPSLSIPYVVGDLDGTFTSQLTYQMAAIGKWRITLSNPDFILKVSIEGIKSEEVGYVRPQQNGQFQKWLSPNENRLSKLAKVELIESSTGKALFGPEYVSCNILYDYDPNFNVNNFVRFSLAQYNFQQIAQRFATVAVDKRLALSIAEQVSFAQGVKE